MRLALVAMLAGCGGEAAVERDRPGDPLPLSWNDPLGFGLVWIASGDQVGEVREPACELGAQFVVATEAGAIERAGLESHCATYETLELDGQAALRAAGAGVVTLELGGAPRNVTVAPVFAEPVLLDCDVDLGGATGFVARSAGAEDDGDEAPAFELEVARPAPLAIDAPVAVDFPVPRWEGGDLRVVWSGGESAEGVVITLAATAEDDDGEGVVRCWTADDGAHEIASGLVEPFRDDSAVLTVSRLATESLRDGDWQLRLWWAESISTTVFPY